MQQAFNTLMGQMNSQSNQFNNAAFSPGSPFPFPTSSSGPAVSSSPPASQQSVTVDVPATKVEASKAEAARVEAVLASDVKDKMETKKEPKKIGNEESIYAIVLILLVIEMSFCGKSVCEPYLYLYMRWLVSVEV